MSLTAFVFSICGLTSSLSFAEEGNGFLIERLRDDAHVQVDTGFRAGVDGSSYVIEVQSSRIPIPYFYEVFFRARIEKDPNSSEIPVYEIEFSPLNGSLYRNGSIGSGDVSLLDFEIGRNLHLGVDEDMSIRVLRYRMPVKLKVAGDIDEDPSPRVFGGALAVDLLAAKFMTYQNPELKNFAGVEVAGIGTEIVPLGWKLGDQFTALLTIGGSANISVGSSNGFSWLSQQKVTAGVKLLWKKWAEFSIQGQADFLFDTGNSLENKYQSLLVNLRIFL